MKYILLILTFSFSAQANWFADDGESLIGAFRTKAFCEQRTELSCFHCPHEGECENYSVQEVEVDDLSKPTYDIKNETPCATEQECRDLIAQEDPIFCHEHYVDLGDDQKQYYDTYWGDRNSDGQLTAWCARQTGYQKKLVKQLAFDQERASIHEERRSERAAMEMVERYRQAGEKVIDHMIFRNHKKQLNPGQRRQVLQQYAEIEALLRMGNLSEARAEIEAQEPDGVLVTVEDKQSLIDMIDSFLE